MKNSIQLSLLDQGESGLLTKPHLPLTAVTKVSSDAPTVPQSPASVAKATKETPVKSVMCPVECSGWKIYFGFVTNIFFHVF